MRDLLIGDKVEVEPGKFSDVFFFSHRLGAGSHQYLKITTEHGRVLLVSPNHYLLGSMGVLVAASSLSVPSTVRVSEGESRIVSIENTLEEGKFNPHTREGTLVVDGFLVSCYTTTVPPRLAHLALLPLRILQGLKISIPNFLDEDTPLRVVRRLPSGG